MIKFYKYPILNKLQYAAEGTEAIECRYDISATNQTDFSRLQLNFILLNMKEGGNCGEGKECYFAGRDHIQSENETSKLLYPQN